MNQSASIDAEEIEKFSKLASYWWDETGKCRMLHLIAPLRIAFIKDQVPEGLAGLQVLDIGCGGGLVAEPLARLGARVTAIDASAENIKAARLHAVEMGLDIDYQAISAEDLAGQNRQFDLITCLEVIEHVADLSSLIAAASQMLRPGAMMILSSLNRTAKSYLMAIMMAEYVLRWVPTGTHDWAKFVRPAELARHLDQSGLSLQRLKGMNYDLATGQWQLSDQLDVNYFLVATKAAS